MIIVVVILMLRFFKMIFSRFWRWWNKKKVRFVVEE